MSRQLDNTDKRILNALQGGFPIAARPFDRAARSLGLSEKDLIARLENLLEGRVLSRFGPLFNIEKLGGAVTLAAMAVPPERFSEVTDIVNAYREVAHNYRRDHRFNMWFVVSAQSEARIGEVLAAIEDATGLAVLNLPKQEEYFLELKLTA